MDSVNTFFIVLLILGLNTRTRNVEAVGLGADNRWNVFGADPVPTIHLRPGSGGQIAAVSGEIQDGDSGENPSGYPWRHHVDFEELHPGEDLIAEETRAFTPPVRQPKQLESPEGGDDSEEGTNHDSAMARMLELLSQITSNSDPWWKGENVCVKREEEDRTVQWDDEDSSDESPQTGGSPNSDNPGFHLKFASCVEKDTKHSCVTHLIGPNINKTIRTDYECCLGYLLNSQKKCQRGTLKSLGSTLAEVGGKEFSRLIQSVGLESKLESENLTLFVPSDDAIAAFMGSVGSIDSNMIPVTLDEESERRRRSILMKPRRRQTNDETETRDSNSIDETDWRRNALQEQNNWRASHTRGRHVTYSHTDTGATTQELQQTLLSHMSKGKLSTDDFVDERVVYSENGDQSVLRLNNWDVGSKKIKTVNCARVISTNHQCSNGIIHLVDRMFKPVTKTIADIVTSTPDLTSLKALLSTSGFLNKFRDTSEHLTLFAPTNAALEKLGTVMLQKLRSGDPCLKRIIQNHVLPFTLCSTIIFEKGQIRNSGHEILDIERTADDKLFVNGSQIITKDIVTTNGVVHIIDAVLLSPNDKPVTSALERAGLTSFLELMSNAGLRNYLDRLNNVTIFAPSNQAIQSLPREVRDNPTRLRDVLMYHIGDVETRACHFTNEQKMGTKFNDLRIRIDLYSMFPFIDATEVTAQCGRLTRVNTPACNGIIHTVDRVLIPPETDILQTLKTQPDFSILTRLIKETNLTETLKATGPFTIFAPTDAAFFALPRETLENILDDKTEGLRVLKQHIVTEPLCCSGVSPNNWFMTKRVKTLSGLLIPVQRDFGGQVMFGNSRVSVCDLTASNGVIHTIDALLDAEEGESSREFMGSCLPRIKEVHNTMFFGF